MLGDHGAANVHGETQQKLDVIANDILMTCLGNRRTVAVVASEEDEEPTILRRGVEGGKYCVVFDPLDGSSNLDVSVSVGTIFSILRNQPAIADPVATILQPGTQQVAAGYILYGASTVFVLTTGHGVDMFVLDSVDRLVRAGEAAAAHPRTKRLLLGQRSEPDVVPGGLPPLSRLGARQRLFEPLHRLDGRATCIASCSRAACSSIRRPIATRRASCG